MNGRVCVLVEAGAAPGRNPLLPPLARELAVHDVELLSHDVTASPTPLPPDIPHADLYLLKGDDPAVLALAGCLHDSGAPCLNDFAATTVAADKARCWVRLHQAGLPVPGTALAPNAAALGQALTAGPRFVKPLRGAHGEGARLMSAADQVDGRTAPWLVQEVVPGGTNVLKMYGVGQRAAVRRMQFAAGVVDAPREPVGEVDPAVLRVGRAAAEVVGLVCWGADVILTEEGPVLVDLNAFPGYRTIPEAPKWVAQAVLTALFDASAPYGGNPIRPSRPESGREVVT